MRERRLFAALPQSHDASCADRRSRRLNTSLSRGFGRSPEPTTDINAETDAVEKRHCSEIGRISSNTSSAS